MLSARFAIFDTRTPGAGRTSNRVMTGTLPDPCHLGLDVELPQGVGEDARGSLCLVVDDPVLIPVPVLQHVCTGMPYAALSPFSGGNGSSACSRAGAGTGAGSAGRLRGSSETRRGGRLGSMASAAGSKASTTGTASGGASGAGSGDKAGGVRPAARRSTAAPTAFSTAAGGSVECLESFPRAWSGGRPSRGQGAGRAGARREAPRRNPRGAAGSVMKGSGGPAG